MKELLIALTNEYNTSDAGAFDALRAATTGGLRLTLQTQNATYPYIVMTHINSTNEYTMQAATNVKTALVQFSIFGSSYSSVRDVYALFIAAFDDTALSYTSDDHLVMERVNETGPFLVEKTWQITIDYNIMRAA